MNSSIILVMRDPVKRVFSDYRMMKTMRKWDGLLPENIEELVLDEVGNVDGSKEIIYTSKGRCNL